MQLAISQFANLTVVIVFIGLSFWAKTIPDRTRKERKYTFDLLARAMVTLDTDKTLVDRVDQAL